MDQVIIYGLGSKMIKKRNWYIQNFDIVGVSDSNPNKKEDIPFKDIPYIFPEKIIETDFDYIIVCSVKAKEIIDYLTDEVGVPIEKIKTDYEVWAQDLFSGVRCYGDKNPDKTIVIIGRELIGLGLFGFINNFLEYIREVIKMEYIPVIDMQNFRSAYQEDMEFQKVNVWEFFFEQPANISVEEAYESKRVIHISDCWVISNSSYMVGNIYYDFNVRREFCEIMAKYIRLNETMRKKISEEYRKLFYPIREKKKKVLGVLYRGTDFLELKPKLHAVQPDIDTCINEVKRKLKEWNMDYVYLSTDDENAVIAMKEAIGEKKFLCYERKRFSNTGKRKLAFISFDRERDRYIKGVDYLTEISLLAKCDSIIAGKAGGTAGALLLNQMKYEQEYFFELGLYE